MSLSSHVRLMAHYNQWMNCRLYEACQSLSHEQLTADQGAFFGSILGTLNHLVVADTVWLKRFAMAADASPVLAPMQNCPMPTALNSLLYPDFDALRQRREELDQLLLQLAETLDDVALQRGLAYRNFAGLPFEKSFFSLLMHLFNHQTHHRGQATTLLSQAGVDMGVTDLVAMTPEWPV